MYMPLVVLAVFAVVAGLPVVSVQRREVARAGAASALGAAATGYLLPSLVFPEEPLSHSDAIHGLAEVSLFFVALAGLVLSAAFYAFGSLNPDEVRRQFAPIYKLFWNKWYFDELYNAILVRPVLFLSKLVSKFDRRVIDGAIDNLARRTLDRQHRRHDRSLPGRRRRERAGGLDLFDWRFAAQPANRQAAPIRDVDRDRHRGADLAHSLERGGHQLGTTK